MLWFLTAFIVSLFGGVLPPPSSWPSIPGRFVHFSSMRDCPVLSPRSAPPTDVRDVRPDDIRVVAALGDSITAGFLARSKRDQGAHVQEAASDQDVLPHLPWIFPSWSEYRGVSYPIGTDSGALTIPNILSHYVNLTGGSVGKHVPMACLGSMCAIHPEGDGTNAAVSGSKSGDLMSQVRDYLIPTFRSMEVKDEDWKFVNLGIGANDICAYCLAPNSTSFPLEGTPKQFASDIKRAVNELRDGVPNLIVNIIGLFRVSSIYKLTLKDPYCQSSTLPPVLPHLPLECSCALLPGPAGDYTRRKMDELGESYDAAVLEVIREWEEAANPNFGAIWQPGTAIDLENWPVEALSPVDCFHPSEQAHRRVAAGIWNRLTFDLERKAIPIRWEDEIRVRCLEEGDRLPVGKVARRFEEERM